MIDLNQAMRLYLITDDKARSPNELEDLIARGIAGGATAVQFREKNSGPTMARRAFELLSRRCEDTDVPLFLNADLIGRFDVEVPFAGYHYSDRTLPLHPRELPGISGYSAHGLDDATSALSHGAHFCTLSPIFPTPSKLGILDAIGLKAITQCRAAHPDAIIVALGGIDLSNAEACLSAGASGIAVIRAIIAHDNPESAARKLRRVVENCVNR